MQGDLIEAIGQAGEPSGITLLLFEALQPFLQGLNDGSSFVFPREGGHLPSQAIGLWVADVKRYQASV